MEFPPQPHAEHISALNNCPKYILASMCVCVLQVNHSHNNNKRNRVGYATLCKICANCRSNEVYVF